MRMYLNAGLKFLIFGVLLALTAPYLGSVMGLSPTVEGARGELGKMGDPLLVGLFFAALGMLNVAVDRFMKKTFVTPPSSGDAP